MEEAVRTVLDAVDTDETLVIVTADHSHTLSINGHQGDTKSRGNDIMGAAPDKERDSSRFEHSLL